MAFVESIISIAYMGAFHTAEFPKAAFAAAFALEAFAGASISRTLRVESISAVYTGSAV